MPLQTITSLADTLTSEQSPSANYAQRPTIMVRDTASRRMFGYVQVRGLPTRDGAIVNSAKLRLFPTGGRTSRTWRLRLVTSAWTPSGLRWANQPDGPGQMVLEFAAGLSAGVPLDIDVTSALTSWLTSGAANYGFRLETTDTDAAGSSFHSMNATGTNARFRPVLLLDVSYPPEKPVEFAPADGAAVSTANPLVTWRYGGEGVASMLGYQFQTSLTSGGFGTPLSDVTVAGATEPQHQLTGVSGELWFRVQHSSSDGRTSPWSDPQSFTVTALGTVTITSTETVVNDPSPTTTWTTSFPQVAFQVILRRVDTGAIVADSGVVSGADGQWAPPRALSVPAGVGVTREVRGFDAVERVATPGAPVYASAVSGPFTIEPTGTVDTFTGLVVAKTPHSPLPTLTMNRATTPDGVVFERRVDDGPWKRFEVEPGDIAVGGGVFVWRDATAPAERLLTYRARALVNGAMSQASNEAAITLRASFIWLVDPDDPTWVLPLAGDDDGSWSMGEDSTVVNVLGSDRSNLVHEGLRGFEGSVTGSLVSSIHALGDASARELLERAWRLKRQPTHVWRLVISDMNIPVVVRNVNPSPKSGAEVWFGLSCDYLQQGELPWEDDAA